MDFTWVAADDTNAIQNAIVDAKGDLIAASAADTPARLAVGNNGETLVADSSTSTGLRWQGNFAAGKNKIINGDFYVNQRGFTSTTSSLTYTFDRWQTATSGGTATYSAQTFTTGAAPVAGYEGKNYARIITTGQSGSTDFTGFQQKIEDVRTLAGQTATISFWAKAASGTPKISVVTEQSFGTGGSPSSVVTTLVGEVTLSTSWVRYSVTGTVPSISGKTIGTAGDSALVIELYVSVGTGLTAYGTQGLQSNTFDIWGVQTEGSNTATAFQTATGTIQGELAACQRYCLAATAVNNGYTYFAPGHGLSTSTNALALISAPVTMRVVPTSISYSTLCLSDGVSTSAITGLTISSESSQILIKLNAIVASGLTAYRPYDITANNSTSAFLILSSEL
jgi:hypothetical protein